MRAVWFRRGEDLSSNDTRKRDEVTTRNERRLIFLDFDGCLNSTCDRPESGLCRSMVTLVSELATATDAHVVLTTSWREHNPVAELRQQLADHGFTEAWRIVDATPYMAGRARGEEIDRYLREAGRATRLVVFDDQDTAGKFDLQLVRPWLVQTNPDRGLMAQDIARGRAVLERGPIWTPSSERLPRVHGSRRSSDEAGKEDNEHD
jgi:Swiss Army Knife RNA repair-like protein